MLIDLNVVVKIYIYIYMKIPHLKLEEIRRNPKNHNEILNKKLSFGKSKYNCWKNAINFFHKPENDINKSEAYLTSMFNKQFVNNRRNQLDLEKFIKELHKYAYDFQELGNDVYRTKTRINFDLNYNNILSGEISRIDSTSQGKKEIYLVIKQDYEWESELRFPLFQYFFAHKYNWDYTNVSVGVYCYETSQHTIRKFSDKEIQKALKEIDSISKKLK